MAAPIIYTGENYMQYRPSQGRALQALSQYAQQQQVRKQNEMLQSRQDRAAFAKNIQLDPMYATHTELNQAMAKILDDFNEDAALVYKEIGGRYDGAQAALKMGQKQAEAMAQMSQIKALDDAMVQANQAYRKAAPGTFREKDFNEAMKYAMETKSIPKDGFLFAEWEDPLLAGSAMFQGMIKEHQKTKTDETSLSRTKKAVQVSNWTALNITQEELIGMTAVAGNQAANIQGWFTDNISEREPGEYKRFMEQAKGDESVAANMWYDENLADLNPFFTADAPEIINSVEGRYQPAPTNTSGTEEDEMYYQPNEDFTSLGRSDGKGDDVRYQSGMNTELLGKNKNGVKFVNDVYGRGKTVSLSLAALDLKDTKDVDLSGIRRLEVVPMYGVDGKIEFRVTTPLMRTKRTANRYERPAKYRTIKDAKGVPVAWEWDVPVTEMLGTAKMSDVMGDLNPIYYGQLQEFWDKNMQRKKAVKAKTQSPQGTKPSIEEQKASAQRWKVQ